MDAGLEARLERIGFDGKIVNVPMDHGITIGATKALFEIETTVDAVTRGGADSVLTQKRTRAPDPPSQKRKRLHRSPQHFYSYRSGA
jgi:DhnA family fructose-bisphosphate aldolase class Ia